MNSKLILGTVQFGLDYGINNSSGLPTLEKVFDLLDFANNYITCLDTARSYGVSEQRIGKYHRENLSRKFHVNTKFSKGRIENPFKELVAAIDRLNISIIDTMMFHSLDDFKNNRKSMELLLKEGKGRYFRKFGVSVYTVEELEQLKNINEVEVIQVSFNLMDNHSKKGAILSELKELGKEIHVRSCFLQGLFFMLPKNLTGNLKDAEKYINKINTIVSNNEISLGELALSYCISKKYIDKVLIGVDSMEQLKQNLKWSSTMLIKDLENAIDSIDVKEEVLLNPSKW
jgi:aryl-alcohol dehydrogenase-like predicted oxidoreductase